MEIDKKDFVASIGGPVAVAHMDSEAKADAIEDFMSNELDALLNSKDKNFPTVAQVEAGIEKRFFRAGVGNLFVPTPPGGKIKKLTPLPERPTLYDFFALRFAPANHVLQSAALALKNGMPEEIILACLLHDTVHALVRADHGYWGAQLYAPYISEKAAFAIQYHQALRFYPDAAYGYEYPDLYRRMFGEDYVPLPHIQADYEMVKKHPWYEAPRLVTVNDFYAFDPKAQVSIDPFRDIIGRHFKQPKEGLGNDNSPVAHMWRTIARPDMPL